MTDDDESTRVVRERILDASPDEVWEALTDEVLLERWLAADVELDLHEGGSARFAFSDGPTRHGRVELVDPAQRLAFTWWSPEDEGASRVEFRLEPAVGRTRLVVTETRTVRGAPATAWGPALAALATMHAAVLCA